MASRRPGAGAGPQGPAATRAPPRQAAGASHHTAIDALLKGFRAAPESKTGRSGPKRVTGVVHLKAAGYGFITPIGSGTGDLFLPVEEARGVSDGDLILVEVVAGRGGRTAAKLVSVIERRRTHALGRYEVRGRGAVVVPRDPALPQLAVIPTGIAKDGDEVRVRLPTHPDDPGIVEAVEGIAGDPRLESLSVAYAKGFSDEFPGSVLADADSFSALVTAEQRRGRRDLTALPLVTIDGEDARDFDDAIYVEKTDRGTRLLVAIADVASYVRQGSALDAEALRRCTSVYFPDRVLPMLPERLSNGLCSLMPLVDRLCLVADMVIDGQGHTRSTELYPAVMNSAARCTYTQVADSLDGKRVPLPGKVTALFPAMAALAKTLGRMREVRGAIDFNLTEQKIVLGEDGKVADVVPRERNAAHRLIESCMLAANEAVAQHFLAKDRPAIFRVHDRPDEDKLENFLKLARTHGLQVPVGALPRPQLLNSFLAQIEGKPEARALNSLMLRSMMQAVYAEENIGHFGLGAEGYLHFTSPIRRYPDLMVHRLLWLEWQGRAPAESEELAAVARRCSERERAAMQAEREIDSYYGALWAADHVGERFAGTVDGTTENGLFVEIDAHMVSGMVSADSLGMGAELDKEAHRWHLGRTGASIGIGDLVEVEILSANIARRQIDLALASAPGQALYKMQPGQLPRERVRRDDRPAGKARAAHAPIGALAARPSHAEDQRPQGPGKRLLDKGVARSGKGQQHTGGTGHGGSKLGGKTRSKGGGKSGAKSGGRGGSRRR